MIPADWALLILVTALFAVAVLVFANLGRRL